MPPRGHRAVAARLLHPDQRPAPRIRPLSHRRHDLCNVCVLPALPGRCCNSCGSAFCAEHSADGLQHQAECTSLQQLSATEDADTLTIRLLSLPGTTNTIPTEIAELADHPDHPTCRMAGEQAATTLTALNERGASLESIQSHTPNCGYHARHGKLRFLEASSSIVAAIGASRRQSGTHFVQCNAAAVRPSAISVQSSACCAMHRLTERQ